MTHSIAPRPVQTSWSYRPYGAIPKKRKDRPIRTARRGRVSVVRKATDTHRIVSHIGGHRKTVASGSYDDMRAYLLDVVTAATDTGRTVSVTTDRAVIDAGHKRATLVVLAW